MSASPDSFSRIRPYAAPPVLTYSPIAKRWKRRMTTFSPVLADRSARSCSIVRPSCLSWFTCCWRRRTTSSIHLLTLPSTIFSTTLAGLPEASGGVPGGPAVLGGDPPLAPELLGRDVVVRHGDGVRRGDVEGDVAGE